MNTTTKESKAGVRIDMTPEDISRMRMAMERAADEKNARIRANHSPEYWERFWEASQRRRLRL